MKPFFICLLFCLISLQVSSQILKIFNSKTSDPIKDVAVFKLDKTKSVLSDNAGQIDVSIFNLQDTLVFQHASFYERVLAYTSLALLNYEIKLEEKLVNLNEVVISANKWEQNKSEVPNKIISIGLRDIEIYNPQTTADLLGNSNEVFIQKSQMGGGSPVIRGFSANSVLLVVDGIRMNNAIYRSGNLQNVISLDPNILESAEVVFGPGSIVYGSDALGGVMNFHTKKVRLNAFDEKKYTTNILSRFASANFEKTFHVDVNYHGEKWGWLTSLTLSDFEDLRQGSNGLSEFDRTYYVERVNGQDQQFLNSNPNVQKQSGYEQVNFLQKFRYRPKDNLDLNYTFYLSTSSNVPRYDRLIQTSDDYLKYSEWYYGPQFWMYHALNLKLQKANSIYDAAQINIAYQNVEESRYSRKFESEKLKSQIENVNIFSLNMDFDKLFSPKTTLFYGIEALYNRVNSIAFEENIIDGIKEDYATRYPDGGSDYFAYAAYASLKSNLNKNFTLTGGFRYSYVKLKSQFVNKQFFDFPYDEINIDNSDINISMGLVYRASKKSQLNFNLSTGFRSPNLDDVAKIFDSTPGSIVVPNKDLKPEKAYNIDLGYIQKLGESANFDMVIFYTYLDDAMVRRNYSFNGLSQLMYDGELSQVQAIVNAASANIYGASVSLNVNLIPTIKFHTNHTFTKGKDDEDNALRHVAPLFGNVGLIFEKNKCFVDFYINYNGRISYENLAPSERDKEYMYSMDEGGNPYSPAWLVFNIKTAYTISDNFILNAGIENIFDKRYHPYSSGISAPGRNFYISVRLKY